MPYFNIEKNSYQVKDDEGKIKHILESTNVFRYFAINKTHVKKYVDYLNRSSVNETGIIKRYKLVR